MLSRAYFGCGIAILAVTGCQAYNPYGFGPMGTYPGAMPMSPAPGTTYVTPPVTVPQGSTLPAAPGTALGSVPGQSSHMDRSKLYGQPLPSTPANGGTPKGMVPDYRDPAAPIGLGQPVRTPLADDDDDFQKDIKNPTGKFTDDPDDAGASLDNRQIPTTLDGFEEPVPFQPAAYTAEVAAASDTDESRPNPYAHDAQNYSWFRGVVEFDKQAQAWYLIYNPDTDVDDRFGGSITLAPNPKLNVLQPNDVVLIKGKIDEEQQDRFGKPVYQIDVAHRLVPKKAAPGDENVAESSAAAEPNELFMGP
jgi:hypothetical protein